ncbi:MAG: hypothetical protein WBX15_17800 [Thermoanaerobaculia bacterium]
MKRRLIAILLLTFTTATLAAGTETRKGVSQNLSVDSISTATLSITSLNGQNVTIGGVGITNQHQFVQFPVGHWVDLMQITSTQGNAFSLVTDALEITTGGLDVDAGGLYVSAGGANVTGGTISDSFALSAGPSWTAGAGAPSGACTTGSFYSRTEGGAGSTWYVCEAGAWAAK